LRSQAFFAALLHGTTLPCDEVDAPVVVPDSILAGSMGTMSLVPMQTVVVPGLMIPLQVLHDRQEDLVDVCLARDESFEIVLDVGGDGASSEATSTPSATTAR